MGYAGARREEIRRLVERWAELYDDHVDQLVEEIYRPDCRVDVKNGISFRGAESFTEIELGVAAESPGRRLSVERVHIVGDTAIVLVSVHFPHLGENVPPSQMCALLTFEGDRIAIDESYMDLRNWPTPRFTRATWGRLLGEPASVGVEEPSTPVGKGVRVPAEMIDRVRRWAALYNDRIEEFAHAAYTPDCRVDVKNGVSFSGSDNLAEIEIAVERVAPGRRMVVDRVLVDGDTAIVTATTHFPHDDALPPNQVCAILTFDGDLIAVDETWMDLRYWPVPRFSGAEWSELLR